MSAVAAKRDTRSPDGRFYAALVALAASIDPRVVTKEPVKLVKEMQTWAT